MPRPIPAIADPAFSERCKRDFPPVPKNPPPLGYRWEKWVRKWEKGGRVGKEPVPRFDYYTDTWLKRLKEHRIKDYSEISYGISMFPFMKMQVGDYFQYCREDVELIKKHYSIYRDRYYDRVKDHVFTFKFRKEHTDIFICRRIK